MKSDLEYQKNKAKLEMKNGRKYLLAIVAEGTKKRKDIKKWCENELKIETRITILGHIQRGGNPTVYDRLMANSFIEKAMERILQKDCLGEVVVYKDSKFDFKSVEYITSQKYKIPDNLMDLYKKNYCEIR